MTDYSNMTDFEVKKLLIQKMREHESIHYVLGWLERSYCLSSDAEIKRAVAIRELNRYEGMTK
jgi:hypothetical protein